jgi:hypothetical protein
MSTAPASAAEPRLYEPVKIGPTWQRGEDGKFILPNRTLGWQFLSWTAGFLKHANGKPWRYTAEQARLTLWWMAIDEQGEFLYDEGVVQRLKGWGKDPLAATWSAGELVGPTRLTGFANKAGEIRYGREVYRYAKGDPIAIAHPEAWVQVAAVSKDQNRNTMRLFPNLFTAEAIEKYQIDLGKEIIYAHHGAQVIEAVTSSPRALEGGRPTLTIKNETHHWLSSNEGHEMANVIGRNAEKAPSDLPSRHISITNAYEPSEESVAQQEREAYETIVAGTSTPPRIMYDSLEAPPEAPLTEAAAPAIIESIRGDSTWLNVARLVRSILNPKNPPSRSRRFWFNQIVAAEDAWLAPEAIEATTVKQPLDVLPTDEVVLFFDGSKSDDATGLVGCRMSDGYIFVLGVWQKPPGERGKEWIVPRSVVDACVDDTFEDYAVVGFFADPGHMKDDQDETRFWDGLIDDWHRRFSARLRVWAVRAGDNRHSVMWDMASTDRTKAFTEAAMQFVSDVGVLSVTHDGHPVLKQHLKNARRYPNKFGVSLWKGHRESARKVDLAVCAVGARMLRRLVLNAAAEQHEKEKKERPRSGRVHGFA